MKDDRIQIKGNKDGVNVNIDMEKFIGFDDMLEAVIKCLSVNKGFYKNSILKITSNFKHISDLEIGKLKDELFQNIHIKDCGAEVSAGGNIIVLGSIRGNVKAGAGGNKKSIIAAFSMQPELMQISDILTTSPDDGVKPSYPEVAKIRDGYIVVEPYLPNKYIY